MPVSADSVLGGYAAAIAGSHKGSAETDEDPSWPIVDTVYAGDTSGLVRFWGVNLLLHQQTIMDF